jgi:flagellar protein FliS
VRDAWAIAAKDPAAGRVLPRELRTREEKFVASIGPRKEEAPEAKGMRWSA